MNGNVRSVFGSLWRTEDLVTSFDGVCIRRPPELTKCRFESGNEKSGLHCDQSKSTVGKVPSVRGWQSIQGGVNLEASEEGDGCFRVLSGSHLLHAKAPWEGGSIKDYYKLSDTDLEWYMGQGCVDTKVTCPKGGMVLWDSRAIHSSTSPVKGRGNRGRFRMTTFVAMNPRNHVSANVAKRRMDAFKEGRTTSHWPSLMRLVAKKPGTRGRVDACTDPSVDAKKEWKSLV